MKEILNSLKDFEKRNNLSAAITFCGDGSNTLNEFWDDDILGQFDNVENLLRYLKEAKYKKNEEGICLSPVELTCNYCGSGKVCDGSYPEGCFLQNTNALLTTHH